MQIFVEKVENPNQEFWIWKKKITNRQTEGIYPSTVSNVGSGISAAIYQKDEAGHVTQIAQLMLKTAGKLDKLIFVQDNEPFMLIQEYYIFYTERCEIFCSIFLASAPSWMVGIWSFPCFS